MTRGIAIGDRVTIKAGDEKGQWGIVRMVLADEYHVAIAGGSDVRVYERSEISKPRKREHYGS
jgi:ribosomal protein L24